jgi:hypothetical protein
VAKGAVMKIVNNKIVAPTWGYYNELVDSIMNQMGYSNALTKLTLLSSAMQVTSAREFNIELDLGNVEFHVNNEVFDITMYVILSNEGVSVYINSNYLDVVHSTLSSLSALYEDMRELITMLISCPITA